MRGGAVGQSKRMTKIDDARGRRNKLESAAAQWMAIQATTDLESRMHIERVVIKNYRCLRKANVTLNKGMNIIVGDNEAGKSTFLEAVHLALTGQLYGRPAAYELHPFLFNSEAAAEYVASLATAAPKPPPEIMVELYFVDHPNLARWKGTNNTLGLDQPGVSCTIAFKEDFKADYQRYIATPAEIVAVPVEYYMPQWFGFDGEAISIRNRPLRSTIVDASTIRHNSLASRYISDIIQDLPSADRVDLSLSYRAMKNRFLDDERVRAVNDRLAQKQIGMSDKKLSLSIDVTSRTNWEAGILPHLDEIPMPLVGKGEQNSVKIRLAIDTAHSTDVILVEEPENHLSHGNLGRILGAIQEAADDRQIITTSHSSFVINKLGVDAVLLFANSKFMRLSGLSSDTRDYFMKLPGYDTLRLILSRSCLLVEGPSDELVIQKAYKNKHGKPPQSDGIDVISVRSLAFKRFLSIAKALEINAVVVTDNDGKPEKVKARYAEFEGDTSIRICVSDNGNLPTLEPQMLAANSLAILNKALGTAYSTDDEIRDHMTDDKAGWALRLFESDEAINYPAYIEDAIK
jgi:putative ATP-dependent endonuclease of the OLD family